MFRKVEVGMITILLASIITALKFYHDIGKPKIFFILTMIGSAYYITHDVVATIIFMLPVVFYSMDTGIYHKAHIKSTSIDFAGIKYLDDVVYWITRKLMGIKYGSVLTPRGLIKYRLIFGITYCCICSLVFSLPFVYYHSLHALPLLLWPIVVRYVEWRWAVSYLFFIYSLGYLAI
jgi:hypothetical protein